MRQTVYCPEKMRPKLWKSHIVMLLLAYFTTQIARGKFGYLNIISLIHFCLARLAHQYLQIIIWWPSYRMFSFSSQVNLEPELCDRKLSDWAISIIIRTAVYVCSWCAFPQCSKLVPKYGECIVQLHIFGLNLKQGVFFFLFLDWFSCLLGKQLKYNADDNKHKCQTSHDTDGGVIHMGTNGCIQNFLRFIRF